jgi:hypothetical protein
MWTASVFSAANEHFVCISRRWDDEPGRLKEFVEG